MRTALLIVLAAVLLITAVLTWGSLGSAVCAYGLIMLGASLLYQRFLTRRSEDDFKDE
ncbi:MAG: hypothetical protein IKY17_01005 [Oscillospiraceae bacterium]|nr:hypothetical protein [Oscillospiraceae bacterium]